MIFKNIQKYSTKEMIELMSAKHKFFLWCIIATIEHQLDFQKITLENIEDLQKHVFITDEDIQLALQNILK